MRDNDIHKRLHMSDMLQVQSKHRRVAVFQLLPRAKAVHVMVTFGNVQMKVPFCILATKQYGKVY